MSRWRDAGGIFGACLAAACNAGNVGGGEAGAGGAVATGESHAMPGLNQAGARAASVATVASAGAGPGGAGASGRANTVIAAEAAGRSAGAAGHSSIEAAGSAALGGAGASSTAAAGSGGQTAQMSAAAGSSGAAAGSATADTASGASRCKDSGLALCEDFESDSIDMSVWSAMQMKPMLDTTRAARGSKSLHMHTTATGASGLTTKKIFPRPEGHYYGRMFVYFDALPTSPQWAHWTIVGANPTTEKGEIRVGGQHDGKIERFGVGTDQGPTGDWTNLDDDPKGAPKPVELKKWLCVEWLHDWANDETRFYLDGVEHESLRTTKDVKHGGNSGTPYEIPELGSVWIGFWNYNQNKPVTPTEFDVWIDEVAFDPERVGCER